VSEESQKAYERIQQEIGRGVTQLMIVQEDSKAMRKQLEAQDKEIIVLRKDIEFTRELMKEKICEMKKDISSIGMVARNNMKEMKEYVCAEIKSSTRGIKLWIAGITTIVLGNIVLYLVTKFWG